MLPSPETNGENNHPVRYRPLLQADIIRGFTTGNFRLQESGVPLTNEARTNYKKAILEGQITGQNYRTFIDSIPEPVSYAERAEWILKRLQYPERFQEGYGAIMPDRKPFSAEDARIESEYFIKEILVKNLLKRSVDSIDKDVISNLLTTDIALDVFAFEDFTHRLLRNIELSIPEEKEDVERIIGMMGEIFFAQKWRYLKEFRYLEDAAKAEKQINKLKEEDIQSPLDLLRLVPVVKTYMQEDKYVRNDHHTFPKVQAKQYEECVKYIAAHFGEDEYDIDDLYTMHKELLKIFLYGEFEDVAVPPPDDGDPYMARTVFAELYARNSRFARDLARSPIVMGHGSGSASLVGFMKYGLKPQGELNKLGQVIAGGEVVWGGAGLNQKALSCSLWYNFQNSLLGDYIFNQKEITPELLRKNIEYCDQVLAEDDVMDGMKQNMRVLRENSLRTLSFLEKQDKTIEEKLEAGLIKWNFPILYLMPEQSMEGKKQYPTVMDKERAVMGGFERREVTILVVPRAQIRFVRKIMADRNVQVQLYPLEDYPFQFDYSLRTYTPAA